MAGIDKELGTKVQFRGFVSYSNWKVLGLLKLPRFGFPTIGQILGIRFLKKSIIA